MIQVSKNRPRSKSRAPTIWCRWEHAGKCRNGLAKIYSRNNNGAYPLATQACFIPNTVDSRFITSVSARAMATKAQDKHEAFLAKTATGIGHSIVGLDYFLDEYQVTLREAIMAIQSAKEPDSNLFVAIDDMNYSHRVVFTYRQNLARKALAAIPGLPLILEDYFGPKIWTWFSEQARLETSGYKWDPEQGLIEIQTVFEEPILDGWEDLDDNTPEESATTTQVFHGFEIHLTPRKNQYNDNGSIQTFHQQDTEALGNNSMHGTATSNVSSQSRNSHFAQLLEKSSPQEIEQFHQGQQSNYTNLCLNRKHRQHFQSHLLYRRKQHKQSGNSGISRSYSIQGSSRTYGD